MPSELESGPMFFFLTMREIVSSSEDSLLSMITRIKTMKLSTFKGENIALMTGQIRMAVKRLRVMERVPDGVEKHILTALQKSSVGKFNAYFSQLEISLRQIPSFELTPEKILKMADSLYREYLECGDWTSAKFTTPPNAFLTDDANSTKSTTQCPRCGKTHDGPCQQTHWKFLAPKPEENEERTVNNRTWYWCSKCRRWNPTHKTNQHVRRERSQTSRNSSSESTLNLISGPPTNISPHSLAPTMGSTLTTPTIAASANVASYDMATLSNSRRSFFTNQFQILEANLM